MFLEDSCISIILIIYIQITYIHIFYMKPLHIHSFICIICYINHPPRHVTVAAVWTWHPTISPTSSVGPEGSEIPEKAANEEVNKNGEVIFTVFLDVMLKNLLCLRKNAKNIWGWNMISWEILIVKSWILCTSKLMRANLRDELQGTPPENDRMSPKFGPLQKENSLPTSILQGMC